MKLARIVLVLLVVVVAIAWWVSSPEGGASSKSEDVRGASVVAPAKDELGRDEVVGETIASDASASTAKATSDVAPAPTATLAQVAPEPLCAVRGCVRDGRTNASILDGRVPDPRMMVRFTRAGERARKGILGEDGCYGSVLLTPGAWTARAMVPGTWRQEHTIDVLPGQRELVLDFVLAAKPDLRWRVVVVGALSRDAVPYGEDVPDAILGDAVRNAVESGLRVEATVEAGRVPLRERDESTVESFQSDGQFVRPTVDGDDLVLARTLPASDAVPPIELTLQFRRKAIDRRTVEDLERVVELRVPASTLFATYGGLHARAVDASTGRPIRALTALHGEGRGSDRTDANGDAWWPLLEEGVQVLELQSKDGRALVPCTVEAGKLTDLGDVRVGRTGRVAGVILGEEKLGDDFGLELLTTSSLDAPNPRRCWVDEAAVDGERRFAFDSVPSGRLVLRHKPTNFTWGIEEVELDVRPGDTRSLELRLRPIHLARIELEPSPTSSWPEFEWLDPRGRLVATQQAARVLAGTYRVRITREGRTPQDLEITVDRDVTRTVRLDD